MTWHIQQTWLMKASMRIYAACPTSKCNNYMADYQHYNMLWYGVLDALPQYNSTECVLRAHQWQVYEFYYHHFWHLHCSSPFSQQCVADMFRNQIKKNFESLPTHFNLTSITVPISAVPYLPNKARMIFL